MDKRLFLALLLTALVVVMTPIVFPTPRPSRTISDTSATNRAADRAGTALGTDARTAVRPATGEQTPAPALGAARQARADTARASGAAMPVVAETTVVRAGGSTYRFINPGAAPVSVGLDEFRSLRPGGRGSVDLVRPGDQLLRYRVVVGADTIALDTIPMRASV